MAHVNEPIAVIGSSCKFPGDSTSPSKLWTLLKNPRDVSSRIDRFRADNWHNKDGHHHGASNVLDAYLLDQDPKAFDAQFFSISGGEADSIDPQQRVLLETVYEGIESAGLGIESLQGSSTAVYVGVMCDDYNDVVYSDGEAIPKYAATGSARSILSNRVSYFFNWTGPSMTIDTACSSSLVGVHQAVQVLRSGESKLAIAAGSNLIFGPKMFIAESNLNMLSPHGKSRMWDADADGYARGEGVACVVLKTLTDAIADGDSIECIIRETGVNQDGRTPGITMPSSSAQAALIKQTYAKAGLDPRKKSDRCQYFECHGTGTKVGDPREAGAIHEAFFGTLPGQSTAPKAEDCLYVGSVKTVIGHTEGTAGIAGLLKASLSLQHGKIAPNMLFEKLNPEIEPFYNNLEIPTTLMDWPSLGDGDRRRASVNSFGFGGTNAHAILEEYRAEDVDVDTDVPLTVPYVFSATSEKSLVANINAHLTFLEANPGLDLCSAAWTMIQRSNFNYRIAFAGTDSRSLCQQMQKAIDDRASQNTSIGVRFSNKGSGILGIFTGQGAQWAAMGSCLIRNSPAAEAIVDLLERSLAGLPEPDRPTWSLKKEMLAPAPQSRIAEGRLSQPLCTAIQIVLVDLLISAGITFASVVGHSSGEIGAAYAAGYISAFDAIRIAYYRGFYVSLARGPGGERGAMLAAGTSPDDANDLCSLRRFRGRLQLAACNSNASVTLSGNDEAAEHAVNVLQDEGKFVRKLKVDTAYHSHHMEPCGDAYVAALQACQIEILSPLENGCQWYSSVHPGRLMDADCTELADTYWMENMLKPVCFAQALSEALDDGEPPALVMELGPHPALKGPAGQIIQEVLDQDLPYIGTLCRGRNDIESLAETLGSVWCHVGAKSVHLAAFARFFKIEDVTAPRLIKALPSYAWDHSRTHWYETRMSRTQRLRREAPHALLGVRTPDETDSELRWRNYIKPAELPWLAGHKIQGQLLFPGSGFAVLAIEAAYYLTQEREIKLIEISQFSIHRALSFANEDAGVETMFVFSSISKTSDTITAEFVVSACLNSATGAFTSMASGTLQVQLGVASVTTLPSRSAPIVGLRHVETEEFYTDLARIGYSYSNMFKGITSLKRAANVCRGTILSRGEQDGKTDLKLHPAPFDIGFQTAFAALGAPGDGRLWTLQIPTHIDTIRFNPHAGKPGGGLNSEIPFDAFIVDSASYEIVSDVELYDETGTNCLLQIEGLHVSPLSAATAQTDRAMFAEMEVGRDTPDALAIAAARVEADPRALAGLFPERCMLYYLKQVHETITPEQRQSCDEHRISILNWASHLVDVTSSGKHPHLRSDWLNDTMEELRPQMNEWLRILPDFDKLIFVGERLLPFVQGKISMLEEFRNNNVLDWLYKEAIGTSEYNTYVGGLLKQLSFRYPRQNILEIGAGTGSATAAAVKALENRFASYTYTDISTAFFTDAQQTFKVHEDKFIYKKLNIEHDVAEQGFAEHGYDVVVASNVLHATQSLETTLKNVHRLLRPGGSLIILEVTAVDWLRTGFMFCGFADWWAGRNDGRPYTPTVTQARWHELFKLTGFSGVDTAVSPRDYMTPYSVILTQAVDAQITLVRDPLGLSNKKVSLQDVLVVGGNSSETFDLVEDTIDLIKPYTANLRTLNKIEQLNTVEFDNDTLLLSFSELDEPMFSPFTPEKYRALQLLSERSQNILWITQGACGDKPLANMMHGVARCLLHERSDSRFQIVDIDASSQPDCRFIAETFMRLHISHAWTSFTKPYSPQWSFEREIYIGIDGQARIGRYRDSIDLNLRYNSSRRLVEAPLDSQKTIIAMSSKTGSELSECAALVTENTAIKASTVRLAISKSSLKAIRVTGTDVFAYLVLGTIVDTDRMVLAFTPDLKSEISVPEDLIMPVKVSEAQAPTLLSSIMQDLFIAALLEEVPAGGHVMIHNPPAALADMIVGHVSSYEKIHVTITASTEGLPGAVVIQSSTPNRVLKRMVPHDITTWIDMSPDACTNKSSIKIRQTLPARCNVLDLSAVIGSRYSTFDGLSTNTMKLALARYHATAIAQLEKIDSQDAEIVGLDVLQHLVHSHNPLTVVDWTAPNPVYAKVFPPEDYTRFNGNVTYLLVGMTGELGLSLSNWMIDRGAKNIALTSRNPQVDSKWVAAMHDKGARVEVFPMDVTDRRSVMSAYRQIKRSLPPVAGVCNGAMVLTDGLLANMPFETFNSVIRPKVEGTILLDELFPENTLDFFIMFSSLTCVTGNIGQSPYAASNCFMVAMAEGRRKRGLAASVINLAGIFGIGYINRTDKKIHDRLENMGYGGVSEWDFHQFFAAAVNVSPASTGTAFEISNGLISFDPEDPAAPAWLKNSKFSRFITVNTGESNLTSNGDALSVKAHLLQQTSEDGVYQVLLTAFISLLYQKLNLPPEENAISPESGLVELGIDSLVAVDVRTWFTKELGVEVQVLALLGGASIATLIADAATKLDKSLIPSVVASAEAAEPIVDLGVTSESDSSPSMNTTMPTSMESSTILDELDAEKDSDEDELVEKVEFEKTLSMSYGSAQFWYLQQSLDDPHTSNLEFRLELSTAIDVGRLVGVFKTIGQRHEALRSAFFTTSDCRARPTMGVLAESQLEIVTKQISDPIEADEESQALLRHTWDIESGQVAKIILLSLSTSTHYLIFGFHHIAMDGFSFNIILNEMNALYKGEVLSPIDLTFSQWAIEQREMVENGRLSQQMEFWRTELSDLPDPLPLLPMARVSARKTLSQYEFEEAREVTLAPQTLKRIKDICKRQKVSNFNFFLALFKILLFRYLDIDKVCIGMADAGRGDGRTHQVVGYLLNLLPIMFERSPKQKFADTLHEAKEKAAAALTNSAVPFTVLLDELKVPRSTAYNPVFQAFIDYRQMNAQAGPLGAKTSGQHTPGRNSIDIILDISTVSADEIRLTFKMQKSLYTQEAAEIMLSSYTQLIDAFVSSSDYQASKINLEQVPIYKSADIQIAETLARGGILDFDHTHTTSHLVEENCKTYADEIALKDGSNNSLTYAEMKVRVDDICTAMLRQGVNEGDIIGIYQQPTALWVCSLLAIWKIGAIYVPLDSRDSLERLKTIVKDCGTKVVLCTDCTKKKVRDLLLPGSQFIDVSTLDTISRHQEHIDVRAQPYATSTILYTSGSTGTPKGVLLNHLGLLNHCMVYSQTHGFGRENVLQQSAFSFDMSPYQIIVALAFGGSIFVASMIQRIEPAQIARVIREEGITLTIATPSEYHAWITHGRQDLYETLSWKFAVSGGESITQALLKDFKSCHNPNLELLNVYGPSEISIGTISGRVNYETADGACVVPLGYPMRNYTVYIVDKTFTQVPVGVDGEIIVAGPGVADGYLNRPEMTRDKFLTDKLSTNTQFDDPRWNRMYRTGDTGRRLANGTIIFKGRADGDTQVKLNGIRMELSGIEQELVHTSAGTLLRAVCTVRESILVAHVEFAPSYPIGMRADFLKMLPSKLALPRYMIPSLILSLDSIPLTRHGKIDRKSIAGLTLHRDDSTLQSDMLTATEIALKSIWERVLSPEIAAANIIKGDSDFFLCGGNSLSIVSVQSLIRKELHVSLSIMDLLQNSDMRSMALKVESSVEIADIDWSEETRLEEDLIVTASDGKVKKLKDGSGFELVLTGATGYLGSRFISRLLKDPCIKKIHCVAVRAEGTRSRDLLSSSAKIISYLGDLASPMLGLSVAQWRHLASKADAIVHLGANRSFWDHYEVTRGPNFASTKELIKLSAAYKIPFHFMSSYGVVVAAEGTPGGSETQPPVNGTSGYLASKWASEVYIRKATETLGLPLHVHRVVPSKSASEPSAEVMATFLEITDQTKILPDWQGWSGNFDIIDADALADTIIRKATLEAGPKWSSNQLDIRHVCATRLEMADLEAYINAQSKDRSSYERLPPHEWAGRAKSAGIPYHFATMNFNLTGTKKGTSLQLRR